MFWFFVCFFLQKDPCKVSALSQRRMGELVENLAFFLKRKIIPSATSAHEASVGQSKLFTDLQNTLVLLYLEGNGLPCCCGDIPSYPSVKQDLAQAGSMMCHRGHAQGQWVLQLR